MKFLQFLKPTEFRIVIFALFIVIGSLNFYYGWHYELKTRGIKEVKFIPILFPPLIFNENCNSILEHPNSTIGWSCIPSFCVSKYCPQYMCKASCSIKTISIFYTVIYWYLVSVIIAFVFYRVVNLKSKDSGVENDLDVLLKNEVEILKRFIK